MGGPPWGSGGRRCWSVDGGHRGASLPAPTPRLLALLGSHLLRVLGVARRGAPPAHAAALFHLGEAEGPAGALTHSLIHSLIHSLTYSLTHLFTHSFSHSHSLTLCVLTDASWTLDCSQALNDLCRVVVSSWGRSKLWRLLSEQMDTVPPNPQSQQGCPVLGGWPEMCTLWSPGLSPPCS